MILFTGMIAIVQEGGLQVLLEIGHQLAYTFRMNELTSKLRWKLRMSMLAVPMVATSPSTISASNA